MYISKISLVNYRNFANSQFLFNKGINTIIGENGAGKTNLFRAIRLLLDDNLLSSAYKLNENDFNRSLGPYQGHWIILSMEFNEVSDSEEIQSLFVHGVGEVEGDKVEKATYNLFFRPKADIRFRLAELEEDDVKGMNTILEEISLEDYETVFTGKSTTDFNDPEVYKELVGDFEKVKFNFAIDALKYGANIPHQLSISKEVSFTFIKALRDVVSDFHNNRTNPLITLLRGKSQDIKEEDYEEISEAVKKLNKRIEGLPDVQEIREDIKSTIKDAVGQTYSPSSLSIQSNLPSEAERLLQSLKLLIGEPGEDYEGQIHELSLGGANLIFLTLKLLEYKYQIARETFANFLLIEEPEAHIHTHVQKTLFDKLDYGDTQIIYSTHSTQISEVSNVENVNILGKKENYAEVYQPSTGLEPSEVEKVQRYLDAVRSNLLFAKGVILVEGDAEEILIPTMVKSVLGVSLDELGISLINIRSTGFKNVAQLFHKTRIRRKCSIVTDSDQAIIDTTIEDGDGEDLKKYKRKLERSAQKGAERQANLNSFCDGNKWLAPFYAEHTFEVDFIAAGNEQEVREIVDSVYTSANKRATVTKELESADVGIYGKRVLMMANREGKGWFALLLGKHITFETVLPEYLMDAILFSRGKFNRNLIGDMLSYRAKKHLEMDDQLDFVTFNSNLTLYTKEEIALEALLNSYEAVAPDDQILDILRKLL